MNGRKVPTRSSRSQGQQGYILLSLLLIVSLLVIAAAAAAPAIAFRIRRDREEELIYRATQYRRAIRRFTKQTGRFPMKLEDLDSTNGVRYIRKRYKDPITGKDFRLLHMGDLAAATSNVNSTNGSADNQAPTDSSTPAPEQAQTANAAQPAQSSSGFSAPPNSAQTGLSASSSGDTTFGGGVIIGVASTSTKKTIREFSHKNHYNQWLFFYNPTFDRGYEVWGPTPLTPAPANLQGPQNSSGPQPQTNAQQSQSQSQSVTSQQ